MALQIGIASWPPPPANAQPGPGPAAPVNNFLTIGCGEPGANYNAPAARTDYTFEHFVGTNINVLQAWYSPQGNLTDLSGFLILNVFPGPMGHVSIGVRAARKAIVAISVFYAHFAD